MMSSGSLEKKEIKMKKRKGFVKYKILILMVLLIVLALFVWG